MTSPYICKWGILATGGIAVNFVEDLLLDSSKRNASDVQHVVAAIASSSSLEKADDFKAKTGCPSSTKTYSSYEDMVKDKDVHIVYVATPHVYHYENTLLCLENGKGVLCEKPFTINAAQLKHLITEARKRNLFLSEAMWTRHIPAVREVQRLIHEEKVLGRITRVFSDLSVPFALDPKHRIYNPDLGGGALLDVGIYALTWQLLTLYQHPENARAHPEFTSTFTKSPLTGVDDSTVVIGNYPRLGAQGIATTSLHAKTSSVYSVLIQGEKGDIRVPPMPMNPERFFLDLKGQESKEIEISMNGSNGMGFEADAAARCLRDGKKETELCTLEGDSLVVMKIMDEVRQKGDFRYPEKWEAARPGV